MLPLTLDKVSFTANGRDIIQSISCELSAGTRTVILGPNGSGKSVLMRLCHGLLVPTSGRVMWHGGHTRHTPHGQAMVFQRPVMLRRSALANVMYALELAGVKGAARRQRAHAMLEAVGMAHLAQHPARLLSGGEQQRLALARAWALEPQVLFLDEPTANLDPNATRNIEAIIAAVHASGTKIIMTTHSLGQARRIADEILFLSDGRLVERAGADKVDVFFKQPQSPEAIEYLRGELP